MKNGLSVNSSKGLKTVPITSGAVKGLPTQPSEEIFFLKEKEVK
jgi:hypothetical protein